MDPTVAQAYAIRLARGPLYYIWAFDPQSGEVEIEDPDEDRTRLIFEELASRYPHPERLLGYAYRVIGGFRITDWDHTEVTDQYVLKSILRALPAD